MTLGELRRRLADFDPYGTIEGVTAKHVPYSGDHADIALIPGARVKVFTLRKYLTAIIGWRVGSFPIHDGVFVHLAHEGETGPHIVGVSNSCRIVVEEEHLV